MTIIFNTYQCEVKTNYTAQELTTYLNNKANSSTSKLNNTGDITP